LPTLVLGQGLRGRGLSRRLCPAAPTLPSAIRRWLDTGYFPTVIKTRIKPVQAGPL